MKDGCEVVIQNNDHQPPHVHARRNGCWAKIRIGDEFTPAAVPDPKRMTYRDLGIALRVVDVKREFYFEKWRQYHGQANDDRR